MTTAPAIQPYFKIQDSPKGQFSNWSERHIAYVAGQAPSAWPIVLLPKRGRPTVSAVWSSI